MMLNPIFLEYFKMLHILNPAIFIVARLMVGIRSSVVRMFSSFLLSSRTWITNPKNKIYASVSKHWKSNGIWVLNNLKNSKWRQLFLYLAHKGVGLNRYQHKPLAGSLLSIIVNSGSPGPVKSVFIRFSIELPLSHLRSSKVSFRCLFWVKACPLTIAVHPEVRGVQAEVTRVILTPVLVQWTGEALGGRMSTLAYRNPGKIFHSDN